MLNIITKETPIDEELKTRIQFICDFCNVKPVFINDSIRKVEKTNINYIEPNRIINKDTYLISSEDKQKIESYIDKIDKVNEEYRNTKELSSSLNSLS